MINSECELPSVVETTTEKIELVVPSMENEIPDVKDLYSPCFDRDVATYIGGYVVRRLSKDLKCTNCTTGFKVAKPQSLSLTTIRDNGGLIYLHADV